MLLEIDRVRFNDLDYEDYLEKYVKTQTPVIVESVFAFDSKKITPEYVKEKFGNKEKKGTWLV